MKLTALELAIVTVWLFGWTWWFFVAPTPRDSYMALGGIVCGFVYMIVSTLIINRRIK